MPLADQDRYFAEMAVVAERLGADPVPHDRAAAEALIRSMHPPLRADDRTHEVAALVMRQTIGSPAVDLAAGLIMQAGMDLLPDWAQAMHDQPRRLTRPMTRRLAQTVARTLQWAYHGSPNREVWPDDVTVWPRD